MAAGGARVSTPRTTVSFAVLCLMASVTFMAILSELVPSGIMPQLQEGLGIAEQEVGYLVGVYAIASAVSAIPVIAATVTVNRKVLLLFLLGGFALSNFLVAVAPVYWVALIGRLIGGVCAGVMWPMIAAYGMRLIPQEREGQAVAIIMGGGPRRKSAGPTQQVLDAERLDVEEPDVLGVALDERAPQFDVFTHED